MTMQLDSHGRLRHLLTLKGLDREIIVSLLDKAQGYLRVEGDLPARDAALQGRTVTNLFFEPSTRTRASFDLAGRRLGADVLSLDVSASSRKKGESILDTIYTLQAMQTDIFVIRDAHENVPAYIADHVAEHVSVLNAGESYVAHPTQGLLDALTIRQYKPDFSEISVAIIGDIRHSRVARSAAHVLYTLGLEDLRLIGPPSMLPNEMEFLRARLFTNADEGVRGADVVMALRIQKERITGELPNQTEYFKHYGLSVERFALAKPDAIVMHPGPMNRGVEIEGAIADCPQSVITQQVTNGVVVRMAVLAMVIETLHPHA